MFKEKYNFQKHIWDKSTFINMFTYLNSMRLWNFKETNFWKNYCMVFILEIGFQLQWMKWKNYGSFGKIMKIERIMKLQEKYRLITRRVLNSNANPYTGSSKILYSFHWSKFTKRSSYSHKIQRSQETWTFPFKKVERFTMLLS